MVTFTLYVPLTFPAGTEAVIWVVLSTVTVADIVVFSEASSITNVVPDVWYPVPVIVMLVAWSLAPELGETEVIVGAGSVTSNASVLDPDWLSLLVTTTS